MLLTLTTTHQPATDIGFLLHKNPEKLHSVTLNFGNQPEPLVIPFDAVRTFVDPSVEFGLRFETHDDEDEDEDDEDDEPRAAPAGEVVSLDKFRK